MIKTITRIGNSQGIIFDAAIMEMARLKSGDEIDVVVHSGGTITLTPLHRTAAPAEVTRTIRETVRDYGRTLRRLA